MINEGMTYSKHSFSMVFITFKTTKNVNSSGILITKLEQMVTTNWTETYLIMFLASIE